MPANKVWGFSASGDVPCWFPRLSLPFQVLHPGMGTVQLFSYTSLHLSPGWDCSYLNQVYFWKRKKVRNAGTGTLPANRNIIDLFTTEANAL